MHDDLEEESKVHEVYTHKNRQHAASIHQYYRMQQNTDPPMLEKQNSNSNRNKDSARGQREVKDFSQRLKAGSHMMFQSES